MVLWWGLFISIKKLGRSPCMWCGHQLTHHIRIRLVADERDSCTDVVGRGAGVIERLLTYFPVSLA
jgi:hypothetical protein